MGVFTHRHQVRQKAKSQLQSILENSRNVVIIHYSCESFYNRPDGSSPRITSIAVRNLDSGQTASFSIHQVAERKNVPHEDIVNQYNKLERTMLDDFYNYVKIHKNCTWLHWNMRDINFGFAALAHRYRVLGGKPCDVHESQLCDLARLMKGMFGPKYVDDPRLTKLMQLNGISDRDFLTGQQEAEAFDQKEYVKLHQSTLRKVDVMSSIVGRLADGTVKTNSGWQEIHGNRLCYFAEVAKDHPIGAVISLLASVLGIVAFIIMCSKMVERSP